MCGIMGVFSPQCVVSFHSVKELAKQQLLLRGRDAVGAFFMPEGQDRVYAMPLSDKDKSGQLQQFLSDLPDGGSCLMLQSRAIPEPEVVQGLNTESIKSLADAAVEMKDVAEVKLNSIQPFLREGWTVSHNGTIANDRELREKIDIDWSQESSVDSVVLPHLFAAKGICETLTHHVEGSFSIAAYDHSNKFFYLAKNFQPLYYGIRSGCLFYSSLQAPLTPIEFPPYKLMLVDSTGQLAWDDLYRTPLAKSVLVTHSGGLDSTIALRLYQVLGYKVGALFFKYGQQAESVEEYCSRRICDILGIPWFSIPLHTDHFTSPLLDKKKPDLDPLEDAESTFSYVPQRNLIMTAYALAMAEQFGFGSVSLGMNLSDGGGYPDNCVPFLYKLKELTPYSSNWQSQLTVTAPFVNLLKSELLQVGIRIGVPFEYVCSCYYPKISSDGYPVYCGNCGSDVHYGNAWGKLGYKPPNMGFELYSGTRVTLPDPDPTLRLELEDIPYGNVIKETL